MRNCVENYPRVALFDVKASVLEKVFGKKGGLCWVGVLRGFFRGGWG